MTTTDSVL